ncbi:gamma-glutamylcyclotransferase [Roseobacter sp. EG26]|uniref:gamma-glutamylcyclotransferase n=1 Tax=Roseobacter sp. EG26 TaxID=3412477 RepID=UPI003CE45C4B
MKLFQYQQLMDAVSIVRDANDGDLLIAGYGSLPLKPEAGLMPLEPGWVRHHRKELCIEVTRCRGTVDRPGRVAGLVPDTKARSMCMIARADPLDHELLDRLAQRELGGLPYEARVVSCDLKLGGRQLALGFVAALWHPGFRIENLDRLASVVSRAEGACGTNRAYLDLVLSFEMQVFGTVTDDLGLLKSRLLPPELPRIIPSSPRAFERPAICAGR